MACIAASHSCYNLKIPCVSNFTMLQTSCRLCLRRATSMFRDLLLPAITCAVTGATLTPKSNRRGHCGGNSLCKLTSSLPPAPVKPGGSCTRLPSTLLLPSSKCSVHLRNSAIVRFQSFPQYYSKCDSDWVAPTTNESSLAASSLLVTQGRGPNSCSGAVCSTKPDTGR